MKNFKLIFENPAKQDVKDIIDWYNLQQKGLGKVFFAYVKKKGKQLQSFPYSSENRYLDVRTALLEKFPYMLHYIVDYDNKLVVVLAVLHTSQDPKIWNERR